MEKPVSKFVTIPIGLGCIIGAMVLIYVGGMILTGKTVTSKIK